MSHESEPSIFLSLSRLAPRAVMAAAGLLLAFAMQAQATVMQGDRLTFDWLATLGPDAGANGTADVTVGAPQAGPYFGIASFDVTAAGFCGVCTPLTEDLGGAQFDSATSGLLGTITGSFLGQGGATHTFSLVLGDVAGGGGTFTFSNKKVGDGTVVDSGIYSPLVAPVDEPHEMLLLAIGLAGVGFSRRTRKR